MSELEVFLTGMVTMGYLVSGAFFWRFWSRTKDGLFLVFGIAFVLFAANQSLTLVSSIPHEEASWIYLLRFAGYALLIAAIVHKNVGGKPSK